jgi:tetratricopeptide (TPR) repeat protein
MIFKNIRASIEKNKKTGIFSFCEKTVKFLLCGIFFSVFFQAQAQKIPLRDDRDLFFSLERVALKPELVARLSLKDDGRAQKDIAEFAGYYGEGYTQYSLGNFDSSALNFKKARHKWPEYFYADFAIALTYEAKGNYPGAARYYKSYLNKLKDYKRGYYGISAPLIMSFSSGRIEDYDYAYGAVKSRLLARGIDLGRVTPAYSDNALLFGIILFVVFVGALLVLLYVVIPFIKKKIREKNPPEGFWVCPKCGEFTPNLSFDCSSCGNPRPLKSGEKRPGGESHGA